MFSLYNAPLSPLSRSLRLSRHVRPDLFTRRFLSTLSPPSEPRFQRPKPNPKHNTDSNPNPNPSPESKSSQNTDKTSNPETTTPPNSKRVGSKILTVFFSICIGLTFSEHVLNINWISGPSMAPYLNRGYGTEHLNKDMVLVDKTWSGRSDLKRGMVVIFPCGHHPQSTFLSMVNNSTNSLAHGNRSTINPRKSSVKRIIGLPGDRVTTRPSADRSAPQTSHIVPYNHVWVEGDADDDKLTLDSNKYGPISMSLISGRVICSLKLWPRILRWQGWEDGEDEFQSGGETGKRQRMRVEKDVVVVRKPPSAA